MQKDTSYMLFYKRRDVVAEDAEGAIEAKENSYNGSSL